MDTDNPDPDMAIYRLKKIADSEEFGASLQENGLPSCEQLIVYIEARICERNGDYSSARKKYVQIPSVLDALDRQIALIPMLYDQACNLLDHKKYEEAAEIFKELSKEGWKDSEEKYQQAFKKEAHVWKEADCTHPKTCTIHGETVGKPLGHDWVAATFTKPKTCARCGKTEGKPVVKIGTVIQFGYYEQDNKPGNGPEPIEWIVLDYKESEKKILLLSRYCLDSKQYNDNGKSEKVTWEECSLRAWLNGEFLDAGFSEEEKAAILTTRVDNSSLQAYKAYCQDGGKNTQDRIFLLSFTEANKYLQVDYGGQKKSTRAGATAFAVSQGAKVSKDYKTKDGKAAAWWWLRSPGINLASASVVNRSGSLNSNNITFRGGGVRPAFWLNLKKTDF